LTVECVPVGLPQEGHFFCACVWSRWCGRRDLCPQRLGLSDLRPWSLRTVALGCTRQYLWLVDQDSSQNVARNIRLGQQIRIGSLATVTLLASGSIIHHANLLMGMTVHRYCLTRQVGVKGCPRFLAINRVTWLSNPRIRLVFGRAVRSMKCVARLFASSRLGIQFLSWQAGIAGGPAEI
jgi:hypothetical protein